MSQSSEPDHLYLDLSTINNDNTGSKVKTKLEFNDLRNSPFLHNPDNYFLGISRFEIDTPSVSLPIFIPVMLLDGSNTDINKTIYTITIGLKSNGGLIDRLINVNVEWSPEDLTASSPNNKVSGFDSSGNPIYSTQDITTGYYSCYNAKWWLNCINKAFINCWSKLGILNTTGAPFLTIDPNTNLISLYTQSNNPNLIVGNGRFDIDSNNAIGYNPNQYTGLNGSLPPFLTSTTNYVIFFNEPLFNLLSGFPSVYYGISTYNDAIKMFGSAIFQQYYLTQQYLFNYYVEPINYNGLNQVTIDGILYTITTSEYSPVPMWNPVSQMVFSSSLLPISMSLTNTPSVYNNNVFDQTYTSSGNNSNVNNMLTDIEIPLTTGSETKPTILYIPKNEYRLIDLLGQNPINQASFSISWKTKYGTLIPFKLGAQCGANIKLLFRRKRYNLNNLPPYDVN